jgi:hypothetical protein
MNEGEIGGIMLQRVPISWLAFAFAAGLLGVLATSVAVFHAYMSQPRPANSATFQFAGNPLLLSL